MYFYVWEFCIHSVNFYMSKLCMVLDEDRIFEHLGYSVKWRLFSNNKSFMSANCKSFEIQEYLVVLVT